MAMKQLKHNKNGFTLIELMLAITIGAIVAGGIYSTYSSQQMVFKKHEQIATMQQSLRASLAIMGTAIKDACWDPYEKANPRIIVASQDRFHFQSDLNHNGNVFNDCSNANAAQPNIDEFESVAYYLNDADANGVCTNSDGQCTLYIQTWPLEDPCIDNQSLPYPLADQIQSLSFQYFNSNDQTVTFDGSNGEAIKSVLITMTARSDVLQSGDFITKTASKRINLRNN